MVVRKRTASFFVCWLLVAALCLPVSAVWDREGSVQVSLTDQGQPVAEGSLTLYLVGEVNCDGTGFELDPAFEDSGVDLAQIDQADTAKKLAEYAQTHSLSGNTQTAGEDGSVLFEELQPGLYLVAQPRGGRNDFSIRPFFVSIPMEINGEWICNVEAAPKTVPVSQPTEPKPDNPKLPQTGQLNWPVAVLTVVGLGLFGYGCSISLGGKKKGNDE